jgi:predicted DNA-binding antitoxin AbrB/MazE fold protein
MKKVMSCMTTAVEAIYEDGMLRPLQPLSLPEHTHVRLSVETLPDDSDRTAWLAQSERRLHEIWENGADDVFNELLSR